MEISFSALSFLLVSRRYASSAVKIVGTPALIVQRSFSRSLYRDSPSKCGPAHDVSITHEGCRCSVLCQHPWQYRLL